MGALFIVILVIDLAIGFWAISWGRSFWAYFLLSLFLSPIIAAIVLLIKGRAKENDSDIGVAMAAGISGAGSVAGISGGAATAGSMGTAAGTAGAATAGSMGTAAGTAGAATAGSMGTAAGTAGAATAGTIGAAAGASAAVKGTVVAVVVALSTVGGGATTVNTIQHARPINMTEIYRIPSLETATVPAAEPAEAPVAETPTKAVNTASDTKIKQEYKDIISTYEHMGVSESSIVERLAGASDREQEVYAVLNEYCDLYEQMKKAHSSCMTSEQYAYYEQELFTLTDAMLAQQSITVEDFLDFVSSYEDKTEIQKLYDLQIEALKSTNDTIRASIKMLNHPLAKEIMSKYSVQDVKTGVAQGYNIPTMIQLYVMENNDGSYNDIIDVSNSLAYASQDVIEKMNAYAEYISQNTVVQQLNQEYMQKASSEKQEYYQELQKFYSAILQG